MSTLNNIRHDIYIYIFKYLYIYIHIYLFFYLFIFNHMGVSGNVVNHPIYIMFNGEKDDEPVDSDVFP